MQSSQLIMNNNTPYLNTNEKSSKLIEVKLPADCLEVGMHVTRLDRPWTEVPVLLQGLTINSIEDVELLTTHCNYVFIEIDEEFWLDHGNNSSKDDNTTHYPGFREKKEFREELPRAKLTLEETQTHVEEILDSIQREDGIDIAKSRLVISSCVKSILANANALLWLSQIKNQDHYTAEHCMRVGILTIAFGRFLGMKEKELELLGMSGILHDVGKMKIPEDILNKPARLTRIEFDIMRQHTTLGKEILDDYNDLEALIKDVAHYHHERIDGKGYPEKIHGGYLHKYIRMVTIVDAYDAITSNRSYKAGSPAFDALKILFSERGKHFDTELVEAFIRMIGIYPPGTLVELTNGEVGIVVSANTESRLRPKVELVLTANKKKLPPYIINLFDDILDDSGETYAIKSGLANGTYGININDYIQI